MTLITLDLGNALAGCPATKGIGPYSLKTYMTDHFLSSSQEKLLKIDLSSGDALQFVVHPKKGKTVITSLDSLSTECQEGVSLEFLPEIITKLKETGIQFTALQFPHAFMVKGRLSSATYRAHFNHIVLYKDSDSHLNVSIIESTINPIGIYNPVPVLGWFISNSLISGDELLQTKLMRVLAGAQTAESLRKCFDLSLESKVAVTGPILTYKQASTGDKRCSIYVLNAMAAFINCMTSDNKINTQRVSETATAAHQQLNEPDMMAISFPGNSSEMVRG
ncbi:MAG: hypothetical protein P4L65_05305 [Legionella sp.]|nr:hypothetical protein [Legionella sp.]